MTALGKLSVGAANFSVVGAANFSIVSNSSWNPWEWEAVANFSVGGSALNLSYWNPATPPSHYFFMSHHKTGTALSISVTLRMSRILGAALSHVNWMDAQLDYGCPGGRDVATVGIFEDMRAPGLERLRAACQPMRAIHFIRDLPEALFSNYAYFSRLYPGRPHETESFDITRRGPWYRSMSLRDGLRVDCEYFMNMHTQQMIDVHNQILRENATEILEVRSEDIGTDFAGTFDRIFRHLLNGNETMLPQLLLGVADLNTKTWSAEMAADSYHISDQQTKAEARAEYWKLVAEGDLCATELRRRTRLLGYSGDAPSEDAAA